MKLKSSLLLVLFATSVFAGGSKSHPKVRKKMKDVLTSVIPDTDSSIWKSFPLKSDNVNIQILDKISSKVFRAKMSVGQSVRFGTITIGLEKAFVNNPDDMDEVYAYIKIQENGKIIFNDWLFASSPSINLFTHPVYDVRVEF